MGVGATSAVASPKGGRLGMLAAAGIALGWMLCASLANSVSDSNEEEEDNGREPKGRGWEKASCLGKPLKIASFIAFILYWGPCGATRAVWLKKVKPSEETAEVPVAKASSEGFLGCSGHTWVGSSSKVSGPVGCEVSVLTRPLMGDVLLLRSVGLSAFKMPAVAADTEGRLPLGCASGDLGCLLLAARGSAFPAVASAFWVLIGSTLAASLTLLGSFDSDFVVGSGVFTGDLISVRG